jgi:hypothetical protein
MTDRLLVPLERAAYRTLAAPPELTQEPPDMGGVKLHAVQALDQQRDALGRPQTIGEPNAFRTLLKSSSYSLELLIVQPWLAPGPASLEPTPALCGERVGPAPHGLTAHPQLPSNARLAPTAAEQRSRPQPPLLQPLEIASLMHVQKVSNNAANVNEFCRPQ